MQVHQDGIKEWRGLFLPAHETHLTEWMTKVNRIVNDKPAYQYHKLEVAMTYVREKPVTAVDIGAHCGLWSMHLARHFQFLHAFEPVALHRACFERNVPRDALAEVMLYPCALGEKEGSVSIHTSEGSSGDSWVEGEGSIPMRTLDSFDLDRVDFIKLDCEGYELFALRGAEQTLIRCRPCVLVEQKPGRAQKWGLGETDACDYLITLGAKQRKVLSGDYIFTWD